MDTIDASNEDETEVSCEMCRCGLAANGNVYLCTFECRFCSECAATVRYVCPNCENEPLRRARSQSFLERITGPKKGLNPAGDRPWIIWALSFGIWSVVAFVGTLTVYKLYRTTDAPMRFLTTLGWEFCQVLTYAPLTPPAFAFANRYPIRRENWARRCFGYLVAGLTFAIAHIALRAITPYAYWNPKTREFASAIWDTRAHLLHIQWAVLQRQFFSGVVDDITGTFVPIVLVAHALSYYRRFRERELRTIQLEGRLAKAHLQTLKSQLQPHFLFNTMHSISSLMWTDVQAADQMMTRLGDLLRMSLESADTQITALSRELDFLNCYLEIEKVRFADRLKVTMDIAPETLDALVPHLLLQPIVDNAVKHGTSKLTAGGVIGISINVEDGELEIEIKDNGPGFATSGPFPVSGLGLRITRERLESLYGQDQSVELLSPIEGGTITRVCIPFRVQSIGIGVHAPD